MRESPEVLVSQVLEPGEKILWTGRPHVEVSLEEHARHRRQRMVVGIGALLLVTPWLLSKTVFPSFSEVFAEVGLEPRFVVPIVVVLAVMILPRVFKIDPKSRLDRYFNSLTYAMTTGRLLILEGDKIREARTPEEIRAPVIRERAPGFADVNFDERDLHGDDGGKIRDPVARERRLAGFKALPNAQEMKLRIEDWVEGYQDRAAREVADFVDGVAARGKTDREAGAIRVENPALGLSLSVPEEWRIRVRNKKKPQGKIFFDREDWHEVGTTHLWNLIRIEGPSMCRIEIEVFETPPTVTFEKLAESKLADSISGPVIQTDRDCEISGLRGFSVTRRNDLEVDRQVDQTGIAAMVAPEQHTVLHDGRRQIYVMSSWPEDSEDLERAVEAVVTSIQIS